MSMSVLRSSLVMLFALTCNSVYAANMEYDTNRPGSDYRDFDLSSPNPGLCMNSCNADTNCKAWTYVKPGVQGSKARCWLKNDIPDSVPGSCCVSGVKPVPPK
ncbi:PAN domain-containing protein, partial [Desulfobulbus sp. F4]|nr:PAN domain-containing protein [Desulfobulbus sp. F4]